MFTVESESEDTIITTLDEEEVDFDEANTGSADDYFVKQESELEKFQKRIDSAKAYRDGYAAAVKEFKIDMIGHD